MSRHRFSSHERQTQLVPPGVWPGVKRAVIASSPTRRVSSSSITRTSAYRRKPGDVGPNANCGSSSVGPPCSQRRGTGGTCGNGRSARPLKRGDPAGMVKVRVRIHDQANILHAKSEFADVFAAMSGADCGRAPSRRISRRRTRSGSRKVLRYRRSKCCRRFEMAHAARSTASQDEQTLGGSGSSGSVRHPPTFQQGPYGDESCGTSAECRDRYAVSVRRRSSRRSGCRARSCATSARVRAAAARTDGPPAARACVRRCPRRNSSRTRP